LFFLLVTIVKEAFSTTGSLSTAISISEDGS